MAAGPIPAGAIDRYASRYGLDGTEALAEFIALMRDMDDAYLAKGKNRSGKGISNLTDAKDGAGVRSLLRGFGAKKTV